MFFPKVIGYQIKIPALGIEYFPSSGWSGVMWTHQTIQTIAIALSCPPELDGTILLLKTSNTHFGHKHGEIKLLLTKKHAPCWFAFIVLEWAAMQTAGGKAIKDLNHK